MCFPWTPWRPESWMGNCTAGKIFYLSLYLNFSLSLSRTRYLCLYLAVRLWRPESWMYCTVLQVRALTLSLSLYVSGSLCLCPSVFFALPIRCLISLCFSLPLSYFFALSVFLSPFVFHSSFSLFAFSLDLSVSIFISFCKFRSIFILISLLFPLTLFLSSILTRS